MPVSPRDVVGDIRICRYLRFHNGDVAKALCYFTQAMWQASAGFTKYLQYWLDEKIHLLREA